MNLLDTDTVIYSLKGDPGVVQNLTAHRMDLLKIGAITLLECFTAPTSPSR